VFYRSVLASVAQSIFDAQSESVAHVIDQSCRMQMGLQELPRHEIVVPIPLSNDHFAKDLTHAGGGAKFPPETFERGVRYVS